ncbi:hypothetical protein P8C59_003248 [Phyllachora maydis]|uniref:Uncharacterized protein n=1 Tax=Phyllachora maydis TaxID=1825666 RepID=A0AAD9I001_9PEZI|nr:hypothetical protein P8C59_003248 [Phyllachora maydis]
MADQAKEKGIAPKRASNPANSGQSSRPPPPIRTLSEDKEDGEDYSEVIEVLTDSVSAIKNISSTLAFLTNSGNAAATGKTSYNPPIDIGSKEGFKDTITSSIVKELSQKAYTIPDNRISNFLENPDISNTYSNSDQPVLLMLLRNSLSSSPRAAISNPATEAYRAAYVANSSNSTPNSSSNPSKKGKNMKKGKKKASYNIEGQNYSTKSAKQASFILGSYNLAKEEEEESDSSSNSRPPTYTKLVLENVLYLPNINIKIISRVRHYDSGGCLIKETLYRGDRRCIAILDFKKSGFFLNVKGSSKPMLHANFAFPLGLASFNTTKSIEPQRNKIVVEIPSNSIRKEDYRPIIDNAIVPKAIEPKKRYKLRNSPAKGTTLEGIGPSLRGKRPHRPIKPLATAQAPYQSPRKTREPKPLNSTRDLPYMLREPVIKGNKVVEKAISSPTSKKPYTGQQDYYNLLNLAKLWHVRLGHIGLRLLKKTSSITKGLPNFDKMKEADFHCSSFN